ncbi:MAG: low molecular weight phosphotyrosine protein phosphatase [Sinobacteraceae bacterium]|nr:low molecular weight phosphotyrosine protein phosphatase [Nevskiaceae bacterium]
MDSATPLRSETRILFVCMGNICRSPSAEAVLRELARREFPQLRLVIDSAGTHGYHVGDAPDPRSIAAGRARGYDLAPLRARQVDEADFSRFDWLLAMDEANLARLRQLAPAGAAGQARLFLEFASESLRSEVPDPYYGGAADFELVLDLLESASRRMLRQLNSAAAAAATRDAGNRG